MNNQFFKDLQKGIVNTSSGPRQELDPGVTSRRYEPASGIKAHRERIHKESRYADTHKNLPYSFRKAQKPMGQNALLICDTCGAYVSGTTATVGVICKNCGKFSTVSEVRNDG